MQNLLNCPFCGAILKWCEDACAYIHTSDSECFLAGIGVLEEMFILWNTRVTDPLLKEMAEALRNMTKRAAWFGYGFALGHEMADAEDVLQKYQGREATDGNPKT